jgi:hypothetical protein
VIDELDVEVARPRGRTDPAVISLRERALEALQLGAAGAGASV